MRAEFFFGTDDNAALQIQRLVMFDTIHEIRSGADMGVFALQHKLRRGYFIGLSTNAQKSEGQRRGGKQCSIRTGRVRLRDYDENR
jgi:hypothetical protein